MFVKTTDPRPVLIQYLKDKRLADKLFLLYSEERERERCLMSSFIQQKKETLALYGVHSTSTWKEKKSSKELACKTTFYSNEIISTTPTTH
jgi:hypothetical protein